MIACLLMTLLIFQAVQAVLNGFSLPVPQLKDVYCNLKSKTIHVSWTDAPSINGKKAIYDIEVYNPGQKGAVHTESVERTPNLAVPCHWQWISPLPLECLPHAVRLRVRHDNKFSEWTNLRNVTDSGVDDSKLRAYPDADTALAGSKKKFCCIIPKGKTIEHFKYQHLFVESNYTKVGQTYILELELKPSETHGDPLECKVKNGFGSIATVFVGYSPEVHNFTCETRNLSVMECSWTQGRDKNLQGGRETSYSLNGRSCSAPKCSIKIPANPGEMVWNLTAKNYLNETSFTYRANPRHRVYLRAPQGLNAVHVNSTNASLKWHWSGANLSSLPMQCQVQIMEPNKPEAVREERTVDLHSVTLSELHPYTSYSAQVRCASDEHFWKWGDWSEKIPFRTKEDIPQAVDVWMTADSSNRSVVVWKKLTAEQSHGPITEYRLWLGDSLRTLSSTQHCYNISSDHVVKVTVTAMNTAGHSSPSTIMTPSQPTDVKTTRVTGSDGGLELSWETVPGASCGYVLDWYPTHSQNKCGIEWMKIPAGHNSTRINAGLRDGVRYTFSLYACTSDAPKLLQRWEGYAREQAPDMGPKIHIEQNGHDILLSWKEIPLEHQRGFIQGYVINYSLSSDINKGKHETIKHKVDALKQKGTEKTMQETINLLAKTYVFKISAFTSGGEGPAVTHSFTVASHHHDIIVQIIISLGLVIVMAALVTILCYRKRTWLKGLVYPDIPAPQLNCTTSNGIHDFQLLKIPAENVEDLTACEIKPVLSSVKDGEISSVPATNSDCLSRYQNVTGLDINFTDCNIGCSLSNPCLLLGNPSYNPLLAFSTSNCAAPATKAAATEGDDPQTPPPSPQLAARSDSYHALKDACQAGQLESNGRSPLKDDDDRAFDSVQSQTSVSLSQPLRPYQFRQLDHIHPQLPGCSATYQALEDVCDVWQAIK